MTGLMNRACFSEALSNEIMRSSKNSSSFALLLLDLDRFKEVNDTLGHDIGDLVLKRVGSRLISCVKYKGFAARLGGDEFMQS